MIPISIDAGPLPYGLQTLERQTGIELLFDHALVSGLQSAAVQGSLTAEDALRKLLAETDLTVRRAQSGAWIVEHPAAPPLERLDAVVPEILVIGQRTQNADIRRFETDVQPYTVATKAQIVAAHRDNIDQYFASRITANTQAIPGSVSQGGNTLSAIDLRGLGTDNTLVLVDGRRLSGIPVEGTGFSEADINGIPLHAIERIEVLTGTAGGIYGFGALGGVVNVVLDRNTRGLDVHVTQGISSRGDARRQGIEANFGHTSADGRTDLTLFAAYSESGPLLAGQRSFAVRDRTVTGQLVAPAFFDLPHGNSVGVISLGSNLEFKPEFGGATLPSDHTFLPAGFSGSPAALAAALTQHAGQFDFGLAEGDANTDLMSNPRSHSLLLNARHRFSAGLEAYVDALLLRSRGRSDDGQVDGSGFISPSSPANPFTDYIDVSFPIPTKGFRFSKRVGTTRYTAGLVTELPLGWRGTAEVSSGSFSYDTSSFVESATHSFLFLSGPDAEVNPLGDWNTFQQAVAADPRLHSVGLVVHNRLRDQSLRLAGPVFSTAEGPATLTLLAEHRTEDVPFTAEFQTTQTAATMTASQTGVPSRSSATTSLSAELRPRLFGANAPMPFLRGLELQLAVRRDDERADFARHSLTDTGDDGGRLDVRFVGTAYTAGAKIIPWRWLMLRGSYATGQQPPQLFALREEDERTTTGFFTPDPKRGGANLGVDGPIVLKSGGYAGLKAVRASTTFLGAVLTPLGEGGPSLGIDFSRIRRTRDVLALSPDVVVANEDFWPQRVTREPLTDADRARGYTAGRVIALDTRAMNGASLEVDALDTHVQWPLPFLGGRLRLYADGTYHKNNRQKVLFQPDIQSAGYFNGPLKWRANGGVDWSTDRLTIGTNLQYFGRRLVLQQGPRELANDFSLLEQGSRHIPSQAYLDLYTTWRVPWRDASAADVLTVEFGIIHVLDRVPPRESSAAFLGPGYSRYGDPRQRRFELVLSKRF